VTEGPLGMRGLCEAKYLIPNILPHHRVAARAERQMLAELMDGRKSVRIASLSSLFYFAIFLDSTKRIFPDSGVPYCAVAPSGHDTAPPSRLMNSLRLMELPRVRGALTVRGGRLGIKAFCSSFAALQG
jgi:hypothetical protein